MEKNLYYDFYKLTKENLEKLAESNNISQEELKKYYSTSDQHLEFIKDLKRSETSKAFVQMILHAQNATMISSIVNFEKNKEFLKEVTCDFQPKSFLQKYANKDIKCLAEDLRWTADKNKGLKWSSTKSKNDNKDQIVTRFAKTLLECAKFLSELNSKQEIINKLTANAHNTQTLIKNFKSQIKTGFGIALTCDFLKEFDEQFNDLAKPDVHLIDVMTKLKKREENYYNSDKSKIKLLDEMKEMAACINENLPDNEKITVYQLDRMIWLVCTENFFLHKKPVKEKYLNMIENLCK